MKKFLESKYVLWALLSMPALGMALEAATAPSDRVYHALLHPSGEFAARFLIVSLLATPLMYWFRAGWTRWLVRNRRYFGVAAFAYAALHTALYLVTEPLARVLNEATRLDILAGWLAFAIFIPLAATSFDAAVRWMGPAWKSLQRWVYAAAVLTFVHWAALHGWSSPWAAMLHFAPLGALSLWRVLRTRPSDRAPAAPHGA